MAELEIWLQQATRGLAKDSAAQVRSEIQQHYESAREAALGAGATSEDVKSAALAALGDAGIANRQYRRVLLTASDAMLLRQGNREARLVCSKSWLRWFLPGAASVALLAAAALFFTGRAQLARIPLAIGIGTGVAFFAPRLPIYTPARSRVYRVFRLLLDAGLLILVFGRQALRMFWLIVLCLRQISWVEWRRASIRRKLPVPQWPKQLYL